MRRNDMIRELKAERTALLAQLNIITNERSFCPALDLDEYREMRRRVNARITMIDCDLARLESVKPTVMKSGPFFPASEAERQTFLQRVLRSMFKHTRPKPRTPFPCRSASEDGGRAGVGGHS
jgi:hypothetical protein